MLGPHQLISEINAITGIHGRLAGHAGCLPAQNAGTLHLIVRLFVGERELGDRRGSFGCDLFMLGKFGFAADAAVGRIVHGLVEFPLNPLIWPGHAGW